MPYPLKMLQKRIAIQLVLFVACAISIVVFRLGRERDDDGDYSDDDSDDDGDGDSNQKEYHKREILNNIIKNLTKHAQKIITRNKTYAGLLRYFEDEDFTFHTTDPNGERLFTGECIKSPSDPPVTICVHPKEDDLMSGYIIDRQCHCWEPEVGDMVIEMLHHYPDAVYVDAGANLGTHAVMAAAAGHEVWAVEPLTTNMVKMYQSAVKTGVIDKMTLVQNGVDFNRTVSHIRAAMGGIAGSQMKPNITGLRSDEEMGIAEEEYERVHTILLTDVIDAINEKNYPRSSSKRLPVVLKIDVESYECRAFLGSPDLLSDPRAYIPYVIMEWAYLDNDPNGDVCPEEMLRKVTAFFTSHNYTAFQLEDIYHVGESEVKSMKWMDPAGSLDWANSNIMWVHKDALPLILTFFGAKAFDKLIALNDHNILWHGPKLKLFDEQTDECVEQSPAVKKFTVCVHDEANDPLVSTAIRKNEFKWNPMAKVLMKVFENYPDCLFLDAGSNNLGAFGLLAAANGHRTCIMESVKGNLAFIYQSVQHAAFPDKVHVLRNGIDDKRGRVISHGDRQNLARSILEPNISRSIGQLWAVQDGMVWDGMDGIQDLYLSEYDFVNMVFLSDIIKNIKAKEPMKTGSKLDIVLKVIVSNRHLRAILKSESILDDPDINIPYLFMTAEYNAQGERLPCDLVILQSVSKLLSSKGYILFDMEGQSHFVNARVEKKEAAGFAVMQPETVMWMRKDAAMPVNKKEPEKELEPDLRFLHIH
jgi:FkbM family methyltransferase